MSVSHDKADGCELPEELRRYYLDAMGVQVWDELYPQVVAADEPKASWPELESVVQQCKLCDLHSSRSQIVFGAGNQNASLLLVGEAPKQEEEAQVLPFVGEAGDLLTAMLKAIDLQREDVYLTNIVKCRAPEKRHPSADELESCFQYLRQQINLLQPKVIYAVGAMAAQTLLKSDKNISELREQEHEFEGIPLIASFHPAYLLRKPSEKRKAWADLQQVKKLLAE